MAKNTGWEIVHSSTDERTDRMKVQGGHLYRTQFWNTETPTAVVCSAALAFVPYNDRYGDPIE